MTGFPLRRHTIFVALAGSHAHGTARSGSDVDLRGVCVAPLRIRASFRESFEQYEGEMDQELREAVFAGLRGHPTASQGLSDKIDCTIFDVAKFVGLCANANPNALEILYADRRDWVFKTSAWERLYAERRRFLSLKVQQTYAGYAMAQLKRIKSHRSWLLNPPAKKPTRTDFGLPEQGTLNQDDRNRIEQGIAEKISGWGIETLEMPKATRIALNERLEAFRSDVLAAEAEEVADRLRETAARNLGISKQLMEALEGERKYRGALKRWDSYQTWKQQRNPDRAKLEAQFGYDTKHGMHLLRLMRTGLEILRTGELQVRRPDAAELSAIRDGAMTYGELLAEAEHLREGMDTAAGNADLPADVDYEALDELLYTLIRDEGCC